MELNINEKIENINSIKIIRDKLFIESLLNIDNKKILNYLVNEYIKGSKEERLIKLVDGVLDLILDSFGS